MSDFVPPTEVGCPIPPNTPHAVSVTLPTWEANIAYEEGEDWIVSKFVSGYPRFFIHSSIQKLAKFLEDKYSATDDEKCFIFPTYAVASRCRDFMNKYTKLSPCPKFRILQISTPNAHRYTQSRVKSNTGKIKDPLDNYVARFSAIFFPSSEFYLAKQYWQHSGEGISSRMAEFCFNKLTDHTPSNSPSALLTSQTNDFKLHKPGSKCGGFHKNSACQADNHDHTDENSEKEAEEKSGAQESQIFLEERYGRNLDLSFAKDAAQALKRRISTKINEGATAMATVPTKQVEENDVYLFPTGMTSIFTAHRLLMDLLGKDLKSVCFGFPYVDTRNILKKFGPGYEFYGMGDDKSLKELEEYLKKMKSENKKILGVFCEFPSNPLLKAVDLAKLNELSKTYDFPIVVDETIGNISNVHLLPHVDILVSSLTKVFSGDSNVMGGSLVLNPESRYYTALKEALNNTDEEDPKFIDTNLLWIEDVIYLERNSRDFAERSAKINKTAEAVAEVFKNSPLIKDLFYPKYNDTKKYYDAYKIGGYGGLMSIIFHDPAKAQKLYNAVYTAKGPSLGTNFTLTSPYAILAHYGELDYVQQFGVDRNLIRISIGLEDKADICSRFQKALDIC